MKVLRMQCLSYDFHAWLSPAVPGMAVYQVQYPGQLPGMKGGPMRIDENPLFRKVPVPWYDSAPACILVIVLMLAVVFFSLTGIALTMEQPEYQDYVWVPLAVMTPALLVLLSTISRLLRRYLARYFQDRTL